MDRGDTTFRQSAAREFLIKLETPALDCHARLSSTYGDGCMGVGSVS
jgi:hypothetical protein